MLAVATHTASVQEKNEGWQVFPHFLYLSFPPDCHGNIWCNWAQMWQLCVMIYPIEFLRNLCILFVCVFVIYVHTSRRVIGPWTHQSNLLTWKWSCDISEQLYSLCVCTAQPSIVMRIAPLREHVTDKSYYGHQSSTQNSEVKEEDALAKATMDINHPLRTGRLNALA